MTKTEGVRTFPRRGSVVIVSWTRDGRRARGLAAYLGVDPYFVQLIDGRGLAWHLFWWVDYIYKTLATLAYLIARRPSTVIAQSPPSLCPMVCRVYCCAAGATLIVDAHNSAFHRPWVSVPGYLSALSPPAKILVHNDEYLRHLRSIYPGLHLTVLHDRLFDFRPARPDPPPLDSPYFLVPCSFVSSEPLEEVLSGALKYRSDSGACCNFVVSGDWRRAPAIKRKFGRRPGIRFVGRVDVGHYEQLLRQATGVIDMTTAPMVQQCAVVEALGAGVPMVTTDSDTNRRLVPASAVLCEARRDAIARAIAELAERREVLACGVIEDRELHEVRWRREFSAAAADMGLSSRPVRER